MKVLHFLPWYSPRTKGGTEVFLLGLAKLQRQHGDQVEIIAPNRDRSVAYDDIDGIKVTYFPSPIHGTGHQLPGNPSWIDAHQAFMSSVEAFDPDAIHMHNVHYFYSSFVRDIAAAHRIRLCLTMHLLNVVCPNETLITESGELCTRNVAFSTCARCIGAQRNRSKVGATADAVSIAASAFSMRRWNSVFLATRIPYQRGIVEQEWLLDFLRANVHVDVLTPWFRTVLLQNGFDANRIRLRPNPLLDPERFTPRSPRVDRSRKMSFVFVGRLSTEKGLWLLIAALRALADLKGEFQLTFFGRQDEPVIVEALEELRNAAFSINVAGEAPHAEVMRSLREASYLVFPSSGAEMAPLVVQEALQNEIPVIAADLPSAAAFIRPGLNGLLFRRNDAHDLARVLRSVIEEKRIIHFGFTPIEDLENTVYSHYCALYAA